MVEKQPNVHVEIAVDRASGSISGELRSAGESLPFQGWLELLSALEEWRAEALADHLAAD